MEENQSEKGAITVKKSILWKSGTFVFAVLFIISLFTGGFGLRNDESDATGNVIANDQAPNPNIVSEDWTVFENELPAEIKSQILAFDKENPEPYEGRITEFKNYDSIPKTLTVFYSAGCGWCKRYYPVLLEAMDKYPEIEIYTLDLGSNSDVGSIYAVRGTPANIINGKYLVSGYMPIEDLSEVLDKLN
ncbi:MAG: thioredoxin family protein [Candidatus Woesearchaeota archaeon]